MPFYRDFIYPCLVDRLGDPPPIEKVRQQIIPLARGNFLEIGASSGANFVHYDPATLCTIPGIADAVRGIARILKPGGKLIFFELGLAPNPAIQRWQKWLEPIHHWIFQGLYLTRDIPALLMEGGFQIQ
jgi:SAM-dependent methyltransferase